MSGGDGKNSRGPSGGVNGGPTGIGGNGSKGAGLMLPITPAGVRRIIHGEARIRTLAGILAVATMEGTGIPPTVAAMLT